MSCSVTVLYPNESDATFDMKYYIDIHMPMVENHWKDKGLKNWQVVKFENGPDGTVPLYSVQAIISFESADHVKAAVENPSSKPVFDDVVNFSNKKPLFYVGGVVAKNLTS